MNRNPELRKKRKDFARLAISNPESAANELHELASSLKKCKKHQDILFALSQIFCVSESTIEKDLYK